MNFGEMAFIIMNAYDLDARQLAGHSRLENMRLENITAEQGISK